MNFIGPTTFIMSQNTNQDLNQFKNRNSKNFPNVQQNVQQPQQYYYPPTFSQPQIVQNQQYYYPQKMTTPVKQPTMTNPVISSPMGIPQINPFSPKIPQPIPQQPFPNKFPQVPIPQPMYNPNQMKSSWQTPLQRGTVNVNVMNPNQIRPKDPKSRAMLAEETDKLKALCPDYKTPFQSYDDMYNRLYVYHVFNSPNKQDENWDKKVSEVTSKFVKQKEKIDEIYFQILKRDSKHQPTEELLFMDVLLFKEEQKEWEMEKEKINQQREIERMTQSNTGMSKVSFTLKQTKKEDEDKAMALEDIQTDYSNSNNAFDIQSFENDSKDHDIFEFD